MFDLTNQHPMRLRALIESWEREGLLAPGLAAKALKAQPGQADPMIQQSLWDRQLEIIGYVGAVPVGLAGLLLAGSGVGVSSLFLIGLLIAVASPRAVRGSTWRPVYIPHASPRQAPRHRAARHAVLITRGPKTHGVVLNGRYARQGAAITLGPTNSR